MGLAITIGFRLYTTTLDKTFSSFTFLSLKNNGGGDITLKVNASDVSPDVFLVKSGESFAFPYVTTQYEQIYVSAGGNQYSILTDGQIS